MNIPNNLGTIERLPTHHADTLVANAAWATSDKSVPCVTREARKLIWSLARDNHLSPFFHPRFTFVLSKPAVLNAFSLNIRGITCISNDNSNYDCAVSLYAVAQLYHNRLLPPDIAIPDHAQVSLEALGVRTRWILDSEPGNLGTKSFRLTIPLFVARQLFRHQATLSITEGDWPSWSERSARLKSKDAPPMWTPFFNKIRHHASFAGNSQSSGEPLEVADAKEAAIRFNLSNEAAAQNYRILLYKEVAYEQARAVLPQSTFTTVVLSGTHAEWQHVLALRLHESAQAETRTVCQSIASLLDDDEPAPEIPDNLPRWNPVSRTFTTGTQ